MNPVMRALANPLGDPALDVFIGWCDARGIRPVAVTPADVAMFVTESEFLGIDRLAAIVGAISRVYLSRSLADPTFGPASAELNRIAGLDPPASWKKAYWPVFRGLPFELQKYLCKQDKATRATVNKALNEAATARKELAAIQKPPEEANGKEHHAA